MKYVDTSVLVPLFVPEETTARVQLWLELPGNEALAISEWTVTEFASALGLKVRAKALRAEQARAAFHIFRKLIDASFQVLTPTRADFALAAEFLSHHALGLRAGDALHLAIAANEGAEAVYSLDRAFITAARKLKFQASNPVQD